MEKFWKNLVNQVVFVNYNPWENIYIKEANNIVNPCSDLWRRMFIWWDGKVNPCDTDYKSKLSVGKFNLNISKIWKGENIKKLGTCILIIIENLSIHAIHAMSFDKILKRNQQN